MPSASFLIKPVSGSCNLACRYCFYRDTAEHRATADYGKMSAGTAALLVERAFELDAEAYSFGFQGGEPTLAGLGFFEDFVGIVRSRNVRRAPVHWTLQTNGTTLDAAWARFFKREGFLLGVSIDGPRALHDAFRVNRDDSGSHDEAMAGVAALHAESVPTNALCVVDSAVADNAELVYRHLRRRGFDWIQFIPCLDPLGDTPGSRPWSLRPEAFARFLRSAFDLWYGEIGSGRSVNVRWFDDLVDIAAGHPPRSCGMAGRCGAYFTVEADGSVYPCDFYVADEWRLGDLESMTLREMAESPTARRFVADSLEVDAGCRTCFAFAMCRGGCRREREPLAGNELARNRHCAAYRDFFRYAGDRILAVAGGANNQKAPFSNPLS